MISMINKEQKGITLIILVVTIIILLILAGVTISLLVGDNGLIAKARISSNKMSEASVEEGLKFAISSLQIKWDSESAETSFYEFLTYDKLNAELKNYGYKLVGSRNDSSVEYTSLEDYEAGAKVAGEGSNIIYISLDNGKSNNQIYATNMTYDYKNNSSVNVGKIISVGKNFASSITSDNYGEYIDYDVDIDGNSSTYDWKIFYSNEENIFLIASKYLEPNLIPSDIGMVANVYSTGWRDFPIKDVDTSVVQKYLLSGISKFNKENRNFKAMASLLKTEKWDFLVDKKYAISAIGSPTADMWLKSWNSLNSNTEKLYLTSVLDGYYIDNVKNSNNKYIPSETMRLQNGYLNRVYYYKNYYDDNQGILGGSYGIWLASPSASQEYAPMRVMSDGLIGNPGVGWDAFDFDSYSLRPVVCLREDIEAIRDNNGIWKIK